MEWRRDICNYLTSQKRYLSYILRERIDLFWRMRTDFIWIKCFDIEAINQLLIFRMNEFFELKKKSRRKERREWVWPIIVFTHRGGPSMHGNYCASKVMGVMGCMIIWRFCQEQTWMTSYQLFLLFNYLYYLIMKYLLLSILFRCLYVIWGLILF